MKLALAILFVFCLVSVSAYLPHEQNTDLDFSITSDFATSCELTKINAPSGVITIEQTDTSTGTFEFNILSGNFSSIGTYCMNIVCTDGTDTTTGKECREVTTDGLQVSNTFYFLILALSLGIVIFGIAIKDAPVTILGSFGLYFISIYTLFNGIVGIKDPVYTWGIGLIILGLAMYISIRSAYELIVD